MFGLILLCCLLKVSSEEFDKTKWTPKLREPVKVSWKSEMVQEHYLVSFTDKLNAVNSLK